MQKQIIPINKSTENISCSVIISYIIPIIHHSFVNNASTFCNNSTNQFIFTNNFYDLNIDLVYTKCHIDIRKCSDSTCTL